MHNLQKITLGIPLTPGPYCDYILSDVLVCSVAEHFNELCLTSLDEHAGQVKIHITIYPVPQSASINGFQE